MGQSSLQVSLTYLRGLEVRQLEQDDLPKLFYLSSLWIKPLDSMKPIIKYFLIVFFFTVALTSCEKPTTDIDYSGIYQGTSITYNYALDSNGVFSSWTDSCSKCQETVEKGRNNYYILLGGGNTAYFVDGIAVAQTDPSHPEYYIEVFFELKGDSLFGHKDRWVANGGEIGWWVSSSPRDSNNYAHTEYFLKAL